MQEKSRTKIRHKCVPAAYLALVDKEGRVLFMRRSNTGYQDGKLGLPSGHLEAGETPSEALIREVKEEIGLELDLVQFQHVMYRSCRDNSEDDRVDFFFRASFEGQKIENCEPHKCSELLWIKYPFENSDIIPYIKDALLSDEFRMSPYSVLSEEDKL